MKRFWRLRPPHNGGRKWKFTLQRSSAALAVVCVKNAGTPINPLGLFRAGGLRALTEGTAAWPPCKMSLMHSDKGVRLHECFRDEKSEGWKVNRELTLGHCSCRWAVSIG